MSKNGDDFERGSVFVLWKFRRWRVGVWMPTVASAGLSGWNVKIDTNNKVEALEWILNWQNIMVRYHQSPKAEFGSKGCQSIHFWISGDACAKHQLLLKFGGKMHQLTLVGSFKFLKRKWLWPTGHEVAKVRLRSAIRCQKILKRPIGLSNTSFTKFKRNLVRKALISWRIGQPTKTVNNDNLMKWSNDLPNGGWKLLPTRWSRLCHWQRWLQQMLDIKTNQSTKSCWAVKHRLKGWQMRKKQWKDLVETKNKMNFKTGVFKRRKVQSVSGLGF